MIDPTLISGITAAIEQAVNGALSYAPAAEQNLRSLEGKIIRVHAEPINLRLQISGNRVFFFQVSAEDGAEADATIAGSPMALFRLASSGTSKKSGDIIIQGDGEVVHDLHTLLSSLDIDYEAILADKVGSVPAHLLGSGARSIASWISRTRSSLEDQIEEYLKEEGRQVPSRVETEIMADDLDELQLSLDRLEARINKLLANADKAL